MTEGRGADAVILAVGGNSLIRPAMDAVRPGGRVLLFAQTVRGEATIDPAAVCVDEKTLLGSYSASVDLQEESVRFVMNREMDLERLISHRFPLAERCGSVASGCPPSAGLDENRDPAGQGGLQHGDAEEERGINVNWQDDGCRSLRQRRYQD